MQTNNQLKVQVSKDFPVTAERLYEAWTNGEELKKWWNPMNNHLAEVTNDLKQGGTINYIFKEPALHITGEYLEVKQGERLVYSWNWEFPAEALKNASYKLTVEFKNKEKGSCLQVMQENFQDEEGVKVHEDGWNKGLTDLETYISGSGSPADEPPAALIDGNRSGGYNESPEQVKVGGG